MAIERIIYIDNTPELTVVYGPMFCGKSSELIDQLAIARDVLEQKTMLIKPRIDNRYSDGAVVSHSGKKMECLNVDDKYPEQILSLIMELEQDNIPVEFVGIDEVQFFQDGIVEVIEEILAHGKKVIVAGLPRDFRDKPFGLMPQLLAIADIHIEKTAKCMYRETLHIKRCGAAATRTQRLVNGVPAGYFDPVVQIGAKEAYEARCRRHHAVTIEADDGQVLEIDPRMIQTKASGIVIYHQGQTYKTKRRD